MNTNKSSANQATMSATAPAKVEAAASAPVSKVAINARNNRVTTDLGFTPTISLKPLPTRPSCWFITDEKCIPPPPDFKTYDLPSSAVTTAAPDSKFPPNPSTESAQPYWTIGDPESPDPTAAELLISQATAAVPAATANVLLDYETELVSSEMASWENNNRATAVTNAVSPLAPTPVRRQAPPTTAVRTTTTTFTVHGPSLATVFRKGVDRDVTCASPLIPASAASSSSRPQARSKATGVCPTGWTAISSGGEKRIKRWFAGEMVQGYVIAGLLIALGLLGGMIVGAVEDGREVGEGGGA